MDICHKTKQNLAKLIISIKESWIFVHPVVVWMLDMDIIKIYREKA